MADEFAGKIASVNSWRGCKRILFLPPVKYFPGRRPDDDESVGAIVADHFGRRDPVHRGQVTTTVFVEVKLTASTGAPVCTYVPSTTLVWPYATTTSTLAGVAQPEMSV
jgi:hypothetical protein